MKAMSKVNHGLVFMIFLVVLFSFGLFFDAPKEAYAFPNLSTDGTCITCHPDGSKEPVESTESGEPEQPAGPEQPAEPETPAQPETAPAPAVPSKDGNNVLIPGIIAVIVVVGAIGLYLQRGKK